MTPFAPLAAFDPVQLIGIIIMILFFVVPAILQALNKKGQPKRPQRPQRPQRPAAQGPAPQRPGGNVEDEIGEFLRRAAQRRGGQQAPAPPPAARQTGPPVMAQAVDPGRGPVAEVPVGEGVLAHVREHIDTGDFDRRAAELGDEVAGADEQIGERLHETFDHDVGRLAGRPGESAVAPRLGRAGEPEDRMAELPSAAAAGLAAMFSNAQNIRQAIIVNEILTRPEDRWV